MFFCQKEILLLRIRQYVDLSIFHVRGLHVRSGIHSTTHIPTWTEHAIAEHIVMQTLTFSLYIQPLCFDLVKSNCAKLERPGAITRLHASMPFVYFVFMRKMHEKVFFKMRWQADSWQERERLAQQDAANPLTLNSLWYSSIVLNYDIKRCVLTLNLAFSHLLFAIDKANKQLFAACTLYIADFFPVESASSVIILFTKSTYLFCVDAYRTSLLDMQTYCGCDPCEIRSYYTTDAKHEDEKQSEKKQLRKLKLLWKKTNYVRTCFSNAIFSKCEHFKIMKSHILLRVKTIFSWFAWLFHSSS